MCSVYKIIIAISLLSSLSFLRGWEVPGVGNTFWGVLARLGSHIRSEVEYMRKEKAESILTDLQIWQTVAVQKRPKPRAAVIFWARQLIVQCGLYCNIGKLVLLPMKLSCSSIGWRSSEGGRVWMNSSRRNDGPSCLAFEWISAPLSTIWRIHAGKSRLQDDYMSKI